jgi:hypothetical protein
MRSPWRCILLESHAPARMRELRPENSRPSKRVTLLLTGSVHFLGTSNVRQRTQVKSSPTPIRNSVVNQLTVGRINPNGTLLPRMGRAFPCLSSILLQTGARCARIFDESTRQVAPRFGAVILTWAMGGICNYPLSNRWLGLFPWCHCLGSWPRLLEYLP